MLPLVDENPTLIGCIIICPNSIVSSTLIAEIVLPLYSLLNYFVKISELGVLSWRLHSDNYEIHEELKKIREDCGYYKLVSVRFTLSNYRITRRKSKTLFKNI